MNSTRLVLISPTSPSRRAAAEHRPRAPRVFRFSMLSSLSVAAAMPPEVDVRVLDEDIEPIDFEMPADLVGISCMTYNAPRAYEIAEAFRARGTPVILGGYHPTLLPQEAIEHADSVCIGDAEPVAGQMIEDLRRGALQPFYYAAQASLAGLSPPRRDLVRRRDYIGLDAVQATRGCDRSCAFCSVAAFHRSRFRARPVDEVIDEMAGLGRNLLLLDDSLTCCREYAADLFAAMIPLKKRWFSQSSVSLAFDPELLSLAARSGCKGVFVGFESLSERSLRSWKKMANLQRDYLQAVHNLHDQGIAVYAGFVFGGDDERPDIFPRTLAFLLEANVESLQATRLTPFPGTPLFRDFERHGRILDHDWAHYDFGSVVYEPKHMSRRTLTEGVAWVQRGFFSRRAILHRVWQDLWMLGAEATLKAVLPLNLGYRAKMQEEGNFARAALHDAHLAEEFSRGAAEICGLR
jgi:radical SAM superfamily enzyme YgiQ (UPF0313 family)